MANYTEYAEDGTYWTIRKHGDWYRVARLEAGSYVEVERYGWYRRAGAAATAVGLLSYRAGLAAGMGMAHAAIQAKLDELDLVLPMPDAGPGEEPTDAPAEEAE